LNQDIKVTLEGLQDTKK